MRLAKISDVWRSLYSKNNYSFKLEAVEFENIKGLGSGKITLAGGLTIICGANGMGKTTLLNSLFLAVKDIKTPHNHIAEFRFADSLLMVKVLEEGVSRTYLKQGLGDGANNVIQVGYIDSSAKSIAQRAFFVNMTNVDELLPQYGANEYDYSQLEGIGSITGKRYSSCKVLELDDFDDDQVSDCGYDDVIPYFIVAEDGVEYGSEKMGTGELAAHILFWVMQRVNNNSLLFIEEPETFISPIAQSRLMSYMAHYATKKNVWLVITTHSMGVVANVPLKHIKLLSKNDLNVSILENPKRNQVDKILGLSSTYSNILFVEDLASKNFLRSIVNHIDLDLSTSIDVVIAESASSISSILYTFPKTSHNWIKIVGIYDGDMKARMKTVLDINRAKWNFVCLPKDVAPEIVVRDYVDLNYKKFSAVINMDADHVLFALGNLKGENFHDWPKKLSEYLDIEESFALKSMFDIWVDDEANKLDVLGFYNNLKKAIKEEPGNFFPSS
jgi:predicted ATPase